MSSRGWQLISLDCFIELLVFPTKQHDKCWLPLNALQNSLKNKWWLREALEKIISANFACKSVFVTVFFSFANKI